VTKRGDIKNLLKEEQSLLDNAARLNKRVKEHLAAGDNDAATIAQESARDCLTNAGIIRATIERLQKGDKD